MNLHRARRGGLTYAGFGALAMALGLAACGGGGGIETNAESSGGTAQIASARKATPTSAAAATPVAQPQNTEGRLLASNCFQCHGTLGTGGFDSIRGKEASEVLEFMSKSASRDIMAAHAQGYTPAQLQKIISYLQQ